jgi:subtilisin family serine protease
MLRNKQMTECDKRVFMDYAISRPRGNAILYIFGLVLVLAAVHIAQARPAAERNETIGLKSRTLVESLVSASQGIEKLIERERIFDSLRPTDGKMQVIVTLDSPGRTTKSVNWKSQRSRQKWQAEVASVQMEVLSSLVPSNIEIRTVYKNFPCFYAAVNVNAMTRLMKNPRVKHIEPVRKLKRYMAQGIPLMNAEAVRSASGGAGVSIAILDSGVDYTHPQLGNGSFPNNKVIGGTDTSGIGDGNPYPSGSAGAHGTACAGIAAGDIWQPSVGDYIGGVAPEAKIIAVKVFPDDGEDADNYDVKDGIDWCVTNQYLDNDNPIMVISMSLGSGKYSSSSQCDETWPAFLSAVNAAVDAGITVLAAAGNGGYCGLLASPAALNPVISVGSVYDAAIGDRWGFCVSSDTCYIGASRDSRCEEPTMPWIAWEGPTFAKKVACYSNSASFLDILAPGHNAYTTDISGPAGYEPGDFKTDFGKTSAACAYAAGAVALLQSAAKATRGSFLSPAEIRRLLTSTGELITDTKNEGLSPYLEKPLVNVYAAFEAIPPVAYIDIGLRFYDGTNIVSIACESEEILTSPLRIAKNGVIYGIVLVDLSDPHASKIKIKTNSGVKALRKY